MDFSFTEEQELLAENLVEFMDREYPESLIKECDEQKIFPVEANKKFYEAGFGAIGVPEELGGVPADMVTMCLVTSIVYRYSWAGCTYSPLSIVNAADKASPEIRTEMLEGLMSGEKRHSFGNTEPGAGSDAAGIKTSYKKVDGGYVINGHKIYNTYASCSDYNIITAKDPEIDDPYKAVTLFADSQPDAGHDHCGFADHRAMA
ncbi:MAG: acyl-CoA dehydrogenase family protein [Adlercreutzia equolifaciens]